MSSLDSNIQGNSYGSVLGPTYIPENEIITSDNPKQQNSTLSTIEQSEAIASMMVPPPNFPILPPPSDNQNYLAFMVSSTDASGKPMVNLLMSETLKMEEIKNDVLDGWLKNIREIQQYIHDLINSPQYQYQQQLQIKGDQHMGDVTGIQSPTSANAAAANPAPYNLSNDLKHMLHGLERISFTEHANSSSASSNHSQNSSNAVSMVTIPFTAAVVIGGGMALVSSSITTSATSGMSANAFSSPVELIERMQPVFPQFSMQDVIPMINLMVMPPIYFNAWNEAVSNIKNNKRDSHLETAQNFAKDVVKMVSDPAFVMVSFVNKMEGADKMDPQAKNRMATILKLILASVALSLLYSADVGKVQQGKYWGMEAQEFRDLLNGQIAAPDVSQAKTQKEQVTSTLLNLIKAQLGSGFLSEDEKAQTIESILNYVGQNHNIEGMLDPVKVFKQVLAIDDPTKSLENRPA